MPALCSRGFARGGLAAGGAAQGESAGPVFVVRRHALSPLTIGFLPTLFVVNRPALSPLTIGFLPTFVRRESPCVVTTNDWISTHVCSS